MQHMTMNTNHQLVTDRQAALVATAGRGRLRRMLSRNAAMNTGAELDLVALEATEVTTPAVILPARSTAPAHAPRIDKVA